VDGDALIERLQSAAAGIAVGEAVAHLIENVVISSDRPADDLRFGVLQCASYLLAAGHFANAGAAGIVAKNDDIAREKRRVRAGEIEQHVVVPGHRHNAHFGDFRRR
jgi:hypothetical protein